MSLKLKAKSYKCRFLEAGVSNNNGVSVLIKPENLMFLAEKFKGVPFSLTHDDLNPANIDALRAGIVSNVYKGEDGWAWCEFFIDNEEGDALLSQGYNISCAYTITQKGAGGIYNGVEYDLEVNDINADHIAIVDVPHYTDAIVIKNSKINNKIKNMFKFLKSKNKEEALKNSMEESDKAFVKNGEDKLPISELVENYRKMKNEEAEKAKEEEDMILNESDEIDVDGEMVSIANLLEAYKNKCKNEEMKDEKSEEKEEVKNEEDMEEKKEEVKNEEEDKSEEDFKKVKNAKKEFSDKFDDKQENISDFERSREAREAIQRIYGSAQSAIK